MAVYALKVRKSDIGFITMMNDGCVPPPSTLERETYFLFEIDDSGKNVATTFATKREMFQTHDLYVRGRYLLSLKKL
jgi:hypothetical protein